MFEVIVGKDDVFAAQGPVESDYSISYKYAISMCDNMSAFQMNVFAAQSSVEGDFDKLLFL